MMQADWNRPLDKIANDGELCACWGKCYLSCKYCGGELQMSGLKRKAGGLYKYEKKQAKEAEKSAKDRSKEAKKAAKK